MIELYTWSTTNGRRPIIMLEESQIPYLLKPVDIKAAAHKTPAHLAISPMGKIPAMIDTDVPGVSLFESTAMLLYLAGKSGKFAGTTPVEKADVTKWFIFSVANVLPIFATMREHKELEATGVKLLDVMEKQLANHEFIAGAYSIADMAPVTRLAAFAGHDWLKTRPNVKRWLTAVMTRPAVKKALEMKIG
jgi:GSH-dependent disulfide-bond oxidoreductase